MRSGLSRFEWDAQAGQEVYNASVSCQNEYAFLLTPKRTRL
jgi:hypothetical protein